MDHKKYLSRIGSKGGKAGRGKVKARIRTKEQARRAALKAWETRRKAA